MNETKKKKIWPVVLAVVIAVVLAAAAAVTAFLLLRGGSGSRYEKQLDLGKRYFLDGDYEEAIVAYKAAIEIDPKQAAAYIELSDIYMEMEDYEAAVDILRSGLDTVTDDDALEELESQTRKAERRKKRADRDAGKDEDPDEDSDGRGTENGDADEDPDEGNDDGGAEDDADGPEDDAGGGAQEDAKDVAEDDAGGGAQDDAKDVAEDDADGKTSNGSASADDDFFGSGSAVLSAGGVTYYWKYDSASYTPDAVFGNYHIVSGSSNQLVRVSADGTETVLYTGSGFGELYMYRGQLFFQGITDNEYEYHTFRLNLTDCSVTDYGVMDLYALDDVRGKLIVSSGYDSLAIIDLSDDSRFEISNASYLNLAQGILYYQDTSNFDTDAACEGEVILCSIFTDGTNRKILATTPADIYDFPSYACRIPCTQLYGDFIYFTYGVYAGTAHVYQGGGLARAAVDGRGFSVIAPDSAEDVFYITDQDGSAKLYYYSFAESEYRTVCVDLAAGGQSTADGRTDPIGEPFRAEDGCFYWHAPEDGRLELLASEAEIGPLGPAFSDEESLVTIRDVSAVGDQLYFTLDSASM